MPVDPTTQHSFRYGTLKMARSPYRPEIPKE
jgi:hypothetical protein